LKPGPISLKLLDQCNFPESHIDCAVSGGADSMALLLLSHFRGLDITVYHVNHNLRKESKKEAEFVKEQAKSLNASFELIEIYLERGPNLEARAREARYRAFPPTISTGHTMDDLVETIFINLLRGASLKGLSPMSRDTRHPILGLRRSDTISVCNEAGISYVKDPSNSDPRFLRNRIRNELLPLACDIAKRDIVPIIARQSEIIKAEDNFLDAVASAKFTDEVEKLKTLDEVVLKRVLKKLIKKDREYDPSAEDVKKAYEVLMGKIKTAEVRGGYSVYLQDNRLRVVGSK
jgi:tRNA(Ile)-lysidine synthase